MKGNEPTVPRRIAPAALLWLQERPQAGILEAARRHDAARPGVSWVGPALAAVRPVAGDPGIFDTAVAYALGLIRSAGEAAALSVLIVPGRLQLAGEEVSLLPDPLLQDFSRCPPSLPPGEIHLTSYATTRLEVRRRLGKGPLYDGPSGSRCPLARLLGEEPEPLPWRNPELLRRRLSYVPRPTLDAALAAAGPVVRVSGVLGSGKTRSVHRLLSRRGSSPLWLISRPERQGGPSLAAQLAARLVREAAAEGRRLPGLAALGAAREIPSERLLQPTAAPAALEDAAAAAKLLVRWLKGSRSAAGEVRAVVCDGLEAATAEDLDFACRLAQAAGERRFRLVLIARSGGRWPEPLAALPEIVVPPLDSGGISAFAAQVFSGLSLPPPVEERILAGAAGLPFALEEGVISLVHHRMMRQVYGSFFFSGEAETPYLPSARLVQHVEAEAQRLGEEELLRRLALADTPLPAALVGSLGDAGPEWAEAYRQAGLLRPAASPWGAGVEIPFPAVRSALAESLSPEDRERLRRELGGVVGPGNGAAWWRYRLLAGSEPAVPALLAAVESEAASGSELLEALTAELTLHREREGDAATELELLWNLLPLARRLGRLAGLTSELDRALELAREEPKRFLALSGLKSELEEAEGRLAAAEATIRLSLKRWGVGKEPGGALLVVRLGRLLIRQNRHGEARELLEQVEPILKRARVPSLHASCLFYLGNVALRQERMDDALDLHHRALALRRKIDPPKQVGASLSAIGRVSLRLGRYTDALAAYQEAEVLLRDCGDTAETSFALLGIGRVLARLGDYAGASAPLRQALALREEGDDVVGQAIARLAVAENHLHLEHPAAALEEVRRAYFTLKMLPQTPAALGDAEHLLGRILLLQRQPSAREHFAAAAEVHREHQARELLAFDLARWSEAAILAGDDDQVRRLAGELASLLDDSYPLEQRENLELYLFRCLDRLEHAGEPPGRAVAHLRRAYRELLHRAEPLSRELRHRFLFQIPEHEAILSAATRAGLSWPDLPLAGDGLLQP